MAEEPQQQPQREPIIVLARQIDVGHVSTQVDGWQWQRGTDEDRGDIIAQLRGRLVAAAHDIDPNVLMAFTKPQISAPGGALSIADNKVLRRVVNVQAHAFIWEALVPEPGPTAQAGFVNWYQMILGDETLGTLPPAAADVLERLTEAWAHGSRPVQVPQSVS